MTTPLPTTPQNIEFSKTFFLWWNLENWCFLRWENKFLSGNPPATKTQFHLTGKWKMNLIQIQSPTSSSSMHTLLSQPLLRRVPSLNLRDFPSFLFHPSLINLCSGPQKSRVSNFRLVKYQNWANYDEVKTWLCWDCFVVVDLAVKV